MAFDGDMELDFDPTTEEGRGNINEELDNEYENEYEPLLRTRGESLRTRLWERFKTSTAVRYAETYLNNIFKLKNNGDSFPLYMELMERDRDR